VVVMAGVNDDEVLDFAAFAREHRRVVRFIEYMPLDGAGHWRRDHVVPSDEILARIDARWPLEAVAPSEGEPSPADRYRFSDGGGEVGVVASVTRPFCGTCNRLRLTADGAVRNCLFSDDEISVRDLLRVGGGDEELTTALRRAVWGKKPGHGINDPGFLRPMRSMSMIGG
ncbi:MAG: GTP 3',8-cyclase MoaA, partial [Acidimicrobiales bacterium]